MRRFLLVSIAATAFAVAQAKPTSEHEINPNPAASVEHEAAAEHQDPLLKWKWVNFAILAGALGYLIGKQAPPFFKSRNGQIQRDLHEAAKLKAEAEERAAAMEKRVAGLSAEVERLRQEARQQMEHEAERIRQDTASQIARVQRGAEQEIGSLAKHAAAELKAYSAELAIDLAKQRLQAQMNPDTQSMLIDRFAHDLDAKGVRN